MALPKSVTKIKSGNVTYVSSVDKTLYTMDELERAALRDVAKFLRAEMRRRLKSQGSVQSRALYRSIASWVRRGTVRYATKLQMGIYSNSKARQKGLKPAFYWTKIEFGTRFQPAKPFFRSAVYENIDKIRDIEAQYLSYINDERQALSVIDEREEESNAE